jgi:SAM-dependent methyltransferase
VKSAAKKRVRSIVDRVVMPYVDAVVSRIGAAPAGGMALNGSDPAPPTSGKSDRLHVTLHELRTIELERVPKGARRVLSVGANGRWYFDWFEKAVGIVDEHLGVEAFEPKPDDLPPYATWIPDTADHMVDVEDSSVDLVFAGQTTEHLWSAELTGFLEEAHRVLRADGLLVLDSPNRLVTEYLDWSHGGHTVELSLDEIIELVTLAGFEVISTAGIWRSEIDGRLLQLEDGLDEAVTYTRRVSTAHDSPDESFIWWLNARRTEIAPEVPRLGARTKELFELHWNTRICRGLFPEPGADRLELQPGAIGTVGSTLPFLLKAGQIELVATLLSGDWNDLEGFRINIVAPGERVPRRLWATDAARTDAELRWIFEQPTLAFAMSIVVEVDAVRSATELKLPLGVYCDV